MHADVRQGLKDTWTVALGLVPLGLAFGVLIIQTGFDWWWAPIFSIVIYAGSMEFLAISMVTSGVGPVSAALTGFMVNFRHIFYGLSFPRHRISSVGGKVYSTYALTDETYAIVSALSHDSALTGRRIFTIQLFAQFLWVGGGVVGALVGQAIPDNVQGMEFALVALFVVLALDSFRNNPDFSLPVVAALLGVLAAVISPNQVLMVALIAYFLFLLARVYSPRFDGLVEWRRRGADGPGGER